ncbi:GHMP kinase [Aureitalea sp. L0-47]|uniref:GYDIA family GHMP kinase n=1 Tax=Aureitalea sp. L0-47 TaxID=2816962 RepID=UPI0022377ED9|nr:GYDIA family GHMP kinase [Aureitalea sp. L0-47]MCW5518695.1 GHMP kinase [Aureitalea sp. L0-47]
MKCFHSNGKLLLTGEYLVLDGALALAIPTSFGQTLEVTPSDQNGIVWKSYDSDGNCWFQSAFDLEDRPGNEIEETLIEILKEARNLNPEFLSESRGVKVTTTLDFPRDWGLGTSSTLVNNIAQWAGVDPFKLLWNSFGGSGYDIAAASRDTPILYSVKNELPKITPVQVNWPFQEKLHFIHLNKKQDSKEGIAAYRKVKVDASVQARISKLSMELLSCESLSEFERLMELHESIISNLLGIPRVKNSLFHDYPGIVKSLGAWGGDFVLVSGTEEQLHYFEERGYETCIPFTEMIK